MTRIAIIQFPGSNCERETILAVRRAGMEPVEFLWNEPKDKLLSCDGCIIVGGFSYEDRCRAGLIASLDPVIKLLYTFDGQNKPILGICNGAQILVESGLVPGLQHNQIGMALTTNKRIKNNKIQGTGFYNTWINIKKSSNNNAFTKYLTEPICIPAAHAEGRFIIPEKLFDDLLQKNAGMLQYCDANGKANSEFPINPNGSQHNLAAICNVKGNVMAIMPHPERTTNGDAIFKSMRDYIAQPTENNILSFAPEKINLLEYRPANNTLEIIIELIITDNAAISMQKALQSLGYKCKIKRYVHWEIKHNDDVAKIKKALIDSYELFNPRKEILVDQLPKNSFSLLVQDKEDLIGRQKLEILQHASEFSKIKQITRGIIWQIEAKNDIAKKIAAKPIFFNPYAHNYFIYNEGDRI